MFKISQLIDDRTWTTEQAVYSEMGSRMTFSTTVDPEIGIWSRKVTWDYAKQILPIIEHCVTSCFLHISSSSIFYSKCFKLGITGPVGYH